MKKHLDDQATSHALSTSTTNPTNAPTSANLVQLPALAGFALLPLIVTAPERERVDPRQEQSAVVEARITDADDQALREQLEREQAARSQQPIVCPGPGPIASGSDGDAAQDARAMLERIQRVRQHQSESGSAPERESTDAGGELGDTIAFGHGCGRVQLTTDTNSRAYAGNSSFHVLVEGAMQRGAAGLVLGTSAIQMGGQRLPLDLGRLGLDGCSLFVSLDQVLVKPEEGDGIAPFHLPLPDDANLTGLSFYAQGFAVDAATGEVSMADAIEVTIGG